ncbi:RCC1 domain-containing protein [Sandaracinus amylolyticus]|uniref:RCC1 domain-containing protein n=1 Tax=Sandaracinus amylolyticus TaxID=927083 RepID=UPI001F327E92|nr:RCC1 domain-containing protein [Sandaracinus amylolyticus]UJR79447.1 Hypothetical protein I5071_14830 [Sandaracinus amylolyticus]
MRPVILLSSCVLVAMLSGCERDLACGTDLRYDRGRHRCICPNGGEWRAEDRTCVLPDGSVTPLDDAGMGDGGMPCEPQVFHRDADGDGFGDPTQTTQACERPSGYVDDASDCDDACESCRPGGSEVCDAEARDEDCEGGSNEGCACTGTGTRACSGGTEEGECTAGTQSCVDGVLSECVGAVGPVAEVCNGRDDDCDSAIDGPIATLACGSATRASAVGCSAGECRVTACTTGYRDCNEQFEDGCEVQLGTASDCLSCGDSCAFSCNDEGCDDVVQVATGAFHTCALRAGGSIVCWGSNDRGQLGDGTTAARSTIQPVVGITNARSVAAGTYHTCAGLADGTVRCWGWNGWGQIGDATTQDRPLPTSVAGLTDVATVTAGGHHACALGNDRRVRCWGAGNGGDGSTAERQTRPVLAAGLADVVSVSAGGGYTCAARGAEHSAWCWGGNIYGQLGDGTQTSRATPTRVSGLTNVARVHAGDRHACAVRTDGTVACWGDNAWSQLGDRTTTTRLTAVAVLGVSDAADLALGYGHTCARLGSGVVTCWGRNAHGQLGDGTTAPRATPAVIDGLDGVVSLSADHYGFVDIYGGVGDDNQVCAVTNGGLRCWGSNLVGKIGGGTTADRPSPVTIVVR